MSPIRPSRFAIFKSVSDILNCYGFFWKELFSHFLWFNFTYWEYMTSWLMPFFRIGNIKYSFEQTTLFVSYRFCINISLINKNFVCWNMRSMFSEEKTLWIMPFHAKNFNKAGNSYFYDIFLIWGHLDLN